MHNLAGNISFSDDSCLSGVGEGDFYEEWEAIISCRVPPVPILNFIAKIIYHFALIFQSFVYTNRSFQIKKLV